MDPSNRRHRRVLSGPTVIPRRPFRTGAGAGPFAPVTRRDFLRVVPVAAVAAATANRTTAGRLPVEGRAALRFGLIADLHQDIMHDAVDRVTAFVNDMTAEGVDWVLQLGDFCWPHDRNRLFLEAWNRFAGPRYHVLGNHDMDGGFTREQAVAFLGMPGRHYAFSRGGVKFVVLDGNDPGGAAAGYHRFVAAEQLAWLDRELRDGTQPVIVFIHQALDHPQGIENQADVRRLLERPRLADGSPRVLAVFCGHHHQDWLREIAGIHYLQINSASYYWVGEAHAHASYPAAVHEAHPWIRMTCPYREPLWAVVSLDLGTGRLAVEGRRSEWVGPDPWEAGLSRQACPPGSVRPAMTDREFAWASSPSGG